MVGRPSITRPAVCLAGNCLQLRWMQVQRTKARGENRRTSIVLNIARHVKVIRFEREMAIARELDELKSTAKKIPPQHRVLRRWQLCALDCCWDRVMGKVMLQTCRHAAPSIG